MEKKFKFVTPRLKQVLEIFSATTVSLTEMKVISSACLPYLLHKPQTKG